MKDVLAMIDEDGWLKVVIDTRRSEVMKQSKRSDAASEWTDRAIEERETIHFISRSWLRWSFHLSHSRTTKMAAIGRKPVGEVIVDASPPFPPDYPST